MKFYTRVAFLFVAFAAFPLSSSYADDANSSSKELTLDEAKALIDSLPTAHDVVSGTVSTKAPGFYDIYGRQVSFRESAKDLRASLDERRENFEKPRVKAIEGYRGTVTQVYEAETAAYQDGLGGEEDVAVKKDDEDNVTVSVDVFDDAVEDADDTAASEEVASSDDTQEEEEPGLMEKPIPSDSDEEGMPKKKVVMPDDAPEFDPANL